MIQCIKGTYITDNLLIFSLEKRRRERLYKKKKKIKKKVKPETNVITYSFIYFLLSFIMADQVIADSDGIQFFGQKGHLLGQGSLSQLVVVIGTQSLVIGAKETTPCPNKPKSYPSCCRHNLVRFEISSTSVEKVTPSLKSTILAPNSA